MTQAEAKRITLEIHRYLVEHPELTNKEYLPSELWNKIKDLPNCCPLCEIFCDQDLTCPGCPLADDTRFRCKPWRLIEPDSERKEYAKLVVDFVSAWEPKEF